jgi:hypothetical protein
MWLRVSGVIMESQFADVSMLHFEATKAKLSQDYAAASWLGQDTWPGHFELGFKLTVLWTSDLGVRVLGRISRTSTTSE